MNFCIEINRKEIEGNDLLSKLEKCVCVLYICIAIVLGGFAAYFKVTWIDVNSNTLMASKQNGSSFSNYYKKHGQVINTSTNLCIRQEANSESNISDYLYNGMTFDILDKSDNWYKIKYENVTGYVNSEYVEEYDEEPPNPTYSDIQDNPIFKNTLKVPKPIKVELTAYCNCSICSEAWGSETAMQTHTRVGVIAAPKEIPLKSKIYIPELKDYKDDCIFDVEDRGGAVVLKDDGTYIIDVWLPSHDQVIAFGRKKATVYLIQ